MCEHLLSRNSHWLQGNHCSPFVFDKALRRCAILVAVSAVRFFTFVTAIEPRYLLPIADFANRLSRSTWLVYGDGLLLSTWLLPVMFYTWLQCWHVLVLKAVVCVFISYSSFASVPVLWPFCSREKCFYLLTM